MIFVPKNSWMNESQMTSSMKDTVLGFLQESEVFFCRVMMYRSSDNMEHETNRVSVCTSHIMNCFGTMRCSIGHATHRYIFVSIEILCNYCSLSFYACIPAE